MALLSVVVLYPLLTCSPDDPFQKSGNATGIISLSSESGILTDSVYYDSTGKPIAIDATLHLPKFIEDGIVAIMYEDSTVDTLWLHQEYADNEEQLFFDTTCVFLRGGRMTIHLVINRTDGATYRDSTIVFLYCSAVHLSALRIDSADLESELNDTTFSYSVTVAEAQSSVRFYPSVDNPYATVRLSDSIIIDEESHPPCSLLVGENEFAIDVIADDDSTTTSYQITLIRPKSSIATLDSISFSTGELSPDFHPDSSGEYTLTVENDIDTLMITPFPTHPEARVSFNRSTDNNDHSTCCVLPLIFGDNRITLSVTAQDDSTRNTYSITIIRKKSAVATLDSIVFSSGELTPEFHPDSSGEYTLTVENGIDSLTITPFVTHPAATFLIDSSLCEHDETSCTLALSVGDNPMEILITAQDNSTERTYSILIVRQRNPVAALDAIGISYGTLIPEFSPNAEEYHIRIPADSSTIRIRPVSRNERSTVTVSGTTVSGGGWSRDLAVSPGNSTSIPVGVISEDGNNERTYSITINRAFTVTVSAADRGTTKPAGTVEVHTTVGRTITANPAEGYHFVNWSVLSGEVEFDDENNPQTTIDVTTDAEIKADFSRNRYMLTLNDNADGMVSGPDSLTHGIAESISAEADDGYHFSRWRITSGTAVLSDSTSANASIIAQNGPVAVEAHFAKNKYRLTVNDNGHGSTEGSAVVAHGEAHPITATPAQNYHFHVWRITEGEAILDDSLVATTPVTLTGGAATVTAIFSLDRYYCTVTDDNHCTVSASDSAMHGIPFSIIAYPLTGYHFAQWRITNGTATITDPTAQSTTVIPEDGDVTLQATCMRNQYQLTVTDDGNGTVSGSGSVDHGVPHTISAEPATGYTLSQWQVTNGDAAITDPAALTTEVILENGNATVEAVFEVITFEHTYLRDEESNALSVCQTEDGSYIAGGSILSSGTDNYDMYLVRIDPFGDTIWTRTFGGNDYEVCTSVQQTADGGFILCGRSASFSASSDIYCIKTDNDGNEQWSRTYGGTRYEYGSAVRQTTDGGFIIAGYSHSFGTAVYNDYYIVKTNANGDTLWTRTFDNGQEDWAYDVIQTTDGGYVICGYSYLVDIGRTKPDIYIVRTDAGGDTLWTRSYGGADDYESAQGIQQTADGGYIITGSTNQGGNDDILVLKTDADGHTIWTGRYGGSERDYSFDVIETEDGGYIVTGYTGSSSRDLYLFKTDGNGTLLWERFMGGTDNDEGRSLRRTAEGGLIIGGGSGNAVFMIKTDENGLVNE